MDTEKQPYNPYKEVKVKIKIKRERKWHECNTCNKKFRTPASLKAHILTHTGEKPWKCNICGKSFRQSSTLNVHSRVHTGIRPFKCKICGKRFMTSSNLKTHSLNHKGEKPFECADCRRKFSQASGLDFHIVKCTGERHNSPIKITVRKILNKAKRIPNTVVKNHRCSVCLKKFPTPSKLKRHVLMHTGEKPFECNICHHKFTQLSNLTQHTQIVHKMIKLRNTIRTDNLTCTGEKPFECDICIKTFNTAFELKIHTRRHTGEKPYKCKLCRKEFCQTSDLLKHLRTHTGERPYQCKICRMKFSRSDTLRNHFRTHHEDNKCNWYKCNQIFKSANELARHAQTHNVQNPYKCNLCGDAFQDLPTLKLHCVQIHEIAPWPQRCIFCDEGFNGLPLLNKHLLGHIGEKPFFCNLCGKEFQTKQSRDSHVTDHHKGSHRSSEQETRISIETGNISVTSSSEDSISTSSEDSSQQRYLVTVVKDEPSEPEDEAIIAIQHPISTTSAVKEFLNKGTGVLVISTLESSITCQKLTESIDGLTVFHKTDNFLKSSLLTKALTCNENFEDILMVTSMMKNKRHVLVVAEAERNVHENIRQLFGKSWEASKNIQVISDIIEFDDLEPAIQLQVLRNWKKTFGFRLRSDHVKYLKGQIVLDLINDMDKETLQQRMPVNLSKIIDKRSK